MPRSFSTKWPRCSIRSSAHALRASTSWPEHSGRLSQRSRIVAPLIAQQELVGYLYADIDGIFGRFHDADRDLLAMLASQAAVALANARAAEELEAKVASRTDELRTSNTLLEARAAELAIINSVQKALAGELSMQGVYDVVGDKIREVFHGAVVAIRLYDPATGVEHFPYLHGTEGRGEVAPRPLSGFGVEVMRTGKTLLIDYDFSVRAAAIGARSMVEPSDLPRTQLMVPLLMGGQARGILQLNDMDREHAFSPSDVRLLETLAASMSVALENARLFDETQRLLKETERRSAELAIINSIQQGIAGLLSFQTIVELVGEKLRELLRVDTIGIRWYDHVTRTAHFLYEIERGTRVTMLPVTASETRWKEVTSDRSVIVRNTAAEVSAAGVAPGTECSLSTVTVKMVAGDRVAGVVVVESFEREYAFGEPEIRLLQAIVGEMGVALENARLFDETQRRTRETAALAEVGRELSSSLDLDTVLDRIARRAKDLLGADNTAIFLPAAGGDSYRAIVAIGETANEIAATTIEIGKGIIGSLVAKGEAAYVNDTSSDPRGIQIAGTVPKAEERLMVAPLKAGDTVKGVMALWRNGGRPFDDAELAFLDGVARQATVALENARLFNETREALEKQTATAEVLQVISGSVADAKPVFDTIVRNAARLCDALFANVTTFDGERLHFAATSNPEPEFVNLVRSAYPMHPDATQVSGRVVLTKAVAVMEDALTAKDYARDMAIAGRWRRMLGVPMLRDSSPIGVITVGWGQPGPVADVHVELLKTFADQAVIAIENARLFRETQEALRQQTATAEVLQVISSSVADAAPVFDKILESCERLSRGTRSASIWSATTTWSVSAPTAVRRRSSTRRPFRCRSTKPRPESPSEVDASCTTPTSWRWRTRPMACAGSASSRARART